MDAVSLFDEIIEDADELLAVADAGEAEAWASSVLGIWRADDELGSDPQEVDRAFQQHLATVDGPAAAVLRLAVAYLLDGQLPEAEATGSWVAALGSSAPTGASEVSLRGGVGPSILIGFLMDDASEHALLADTDEHGALTALEFGPPLAELLEAADDDPDIVGARPLAPVEAAERIARAWARRGDQPATDDLLMNHVLAERRLRVVLDDSSWSAPLAPPEALPEIFQASDDRDADDAHALGVLASALRTQLAADPPEHVAAAAAAFASDLEQGVWPAVGLVAAGDVQTSDDPADLLVAAAAAVVRPQRPRELSRQGVASVGALEWADWLGAVIGLSRAPVGSPASPDAMIDAINRCPEVSSTIPKNEREYFAWAFEFVVASWEAVGAVADDATTELTAWLLPAALQQAWSVSNAPSAPGDG